MKNESTPQCIGVIIDGNRRWAKARGLPSLRGHEVGYKKLKEFLGWAREAGVRHVIAYVFSTENWKRSPQEVAYLMRLISSMFARDFKNFKKEKTRICVAGVRSMLSKKIQTLVERAEQETALFKNFTVVLALSYGGREEIVMAANRLLADREKFNGKEITKEDFARYVWTADIPDPDLIIRTSGEMRLSNFLTWQSVYSELFFPATLWPDFTKEEFLQILQDYAKRQRRFGK